MFGRRLTARPATLVVDEVAVARVKAAVQRSIDRNKVAIHHQPESCCCLCLAGSIVVSTIRLNAMRTSELVSRHPMRRCVNVARLMPFGEQVAKLDGLAAFDYPRSLNLDVVKLWFER